MRGQPVRLDGRGQAASHGKIQMERTLDATRFMALIGRRMQYQPVLESPRVVLEPLIDLEVI